MAKKKSKIEFRRVNINVPSNLVDRVREYGDSIGVNTTSAFIFLLNQALEQKDILNNMPEFVKMYNELKEMQNGSKNEDLEK